MFDGTAPIPLEYQLLSDAYYHLVGTLRLALPPPPGNSEQDRLRRDHAAIARIADLAPANAAEAELAAQFVAASEQWKDYLRLAQLPEATPERGETCRAKGLTMMRQANSALRLLLRLQQLRQNTEANNAACDRVARIEHGATRMMAEALSRHPHPNPLPEGEGEGATFPLPPGEGQGEGERASAAIPEAAVPPASRPEPTPAPVAEPEPDPACSGLEAGACPGPGSLIAEAEQYAAMYPERAALIRRLGRLPDDISFGPPDDDIVRALVTACTPALAALDVPETGPVPLPIRSPRHGAHAV